MIEQLTDFYRRFGVWVVLTGTLTVLIAANFTESVYGIVAIVAGSGLALSEPLIFFIRRLREKEFPIESGLFAAWGLGAAAMAFYFVRFFMEAPADNTAGADPLLPRLRMALLALFLITYAGFFVYRLALSLSYTAIEARSRSLYENRRNFLQRSVFSIFAALPIVVGLNFLATRWNPSLDLSPGFYSFSENSRTIIGSIDREVTAYVFLPVQQAIRQQPDRQKTPELYRIAEEVRVTMEQLPITNSRIQIKLLNADLPEDRGADFKHVNNGTIIFRANKGPGLVGPEDKPYIERRVYVYTEKDMAKLEREVVRALIQVSSPQKTIYFTASHGERYNLTDKASRNASIEILKDELRFYNFQLKKLGPEEGWPGPVPEDADLLFVAGPSVKFSEEARESLIKYLENDGRVFIAIDPDGKEDFDWLLEDHPQKSFRFRDRPLTNVRKFPGVAFTDSITTHRITENLNIAGRSLLAFTETGYFEQITKDLPTPKESENPLKDLEPTVLVNSTFQTVVDRNRNGRKDGNEENGRFPLAIAYERKAPQDPPAPKDKDKEETAEKDDDRQVEQTGPKVLIYASVGWITDSGLRFPVDQRNIIMAADSLFWLTENKLAAGLQPEERKTRAIQVTDELKLRNIVLGMVLFPVGTGLVMAVGMWLYRRRRKFIGE